MNPQYGQAVEIRLFNGVFFDAIVEEWSDQKSVVRLIGSDEIVIIQKTLQDVILVKILKHQDKQASHEQSAQPEPNMSLGKNSFYIPNLKPIVVDNARDEFSELKTKPINEHLINRMSDLKDEINKSDRKELLTNMDKFKPNAIREVNYVLPRNISISSSTQHTNEEVAQTNSDFNSELQDLFSQEY